MKIPDCCKGSKQTENTSFMEAQPSFKSLGFSPLLNKAVKKNHHLKYHAFLLHFSLTRNTFSKAIRRDRNIWQHSLRFYTAQVRRVHFQTKHETAVKPSLLLTTVLTIKKPVWSSTWYCCPHSSLLPVLLCGLLMLDICHFRTAQNEALDEGAARCTGQSQDLSRADYWHVDLPRVKIIPRRSYPSSLSTPVSRNKARSWVYNLLLRRLNNHPELLMQGMRSTPAIYSHLGTSLLVSRINSCLVGG